MKRGLVFSLCALAALATASQALAQNVDISLNLRYTDPADPSEGGRWFLMAQAPAGFGGIAGISAYISNIDTSGIVFGNATAIGGYPVVDGATLNPNVNLAGNPYWQTITGEGPGGIDVVNVVFGQDNSATGSITLGVGSSLGMVANDPLHNADWNASALIMSGTFGANRPVFVTGVGTENNETDANVYNVGHVLGQNAVDATVTTVVRGDALVTSGLEGAGEGLARGDANRDFDVDSDDLDIVLNNFNQALSLWNQGDFNDSGSVDSDDLDLVLNNFNTTQTPPSSGVAAAPVPEPSSIALVALASAGVLGLRRRRVA